MFTGGQVDDIELESKNPRQLCNNTFVSSLRNAAFRLPLIHIHNFLANVIIELKSDKSIRMAMGMANHGLVQTPKSLTLF